MDPQKHIVYAVPNDYFPSQEGKSADFVEINGEYHKLVEISADTADLDAGFEETTAFT